MTIFSNSVRPAAILSRIFPLLCILFAAPVFPQGLQPPPHRSSLPLIYGPQTFDWATDRGDYQITVRVYDNDSRVPNTYLWDYEVANGSFMPSTTKTILSGCRFWKSLWKRVSWTNGVITTTNGSKTGTGFIPRTETVTVADPARIW